MPKKWTPQLDERLATAWVSDASDEEIAAALGETVSVFKYRAARLRLGVRGRSLQGRRTADGKIYWTDAEDAELLSMHARGIRYRMIGEALGRSISSVQCRIEKLATKKVSSRDKEGMLPCMRCRSKFRSSGPGNRLCFTCNGYAKEARSQYD